MESKSMAFNALAAVAAAAAVLALIRSSSAKLNIVLNGSPEQVIRKIQDTIDDPTTEHWAVESMLRRLGYVEEGTGGEITHVQGNFTVDTDRGNSLFPDMGGGQIATVKTDEGRTLTIDLNLVPQSVTDNTQN